METKMSYLKKLSPLNTIFILLFAVPMYGQSVVGEWGGNVQSFQTIDCTGDPFVTNDLNMVITDTALYQRLIHSKLYVECLEGLLTNQVTVWK